MKKSASQPKYLFVKLLTQQLGVAHVYYLFIWSLMGHLSSTFEFSSSSCSYLLIPWLQGDSFFLRKGAVDLYSRSQRDQGHGICKFLCFFIFLFFFNFFLGLWVRVRVNFFVFVLADAIVKWMAAGLWKASWNLWLEQWYDD